MPSIPGTGSCRKTRVAARAGDLIHAGDRIVSIEAMKMETAVNSSRDARVAEVLVGPGAVVDAGDLLIVLQG